MTARGEFSEKERRVIEEGAKRSPVNDFFSRTGLLQTVFHYGATATERSGRRP